MCCYFSVYRYLSHLSPKILQVQKYEDLTNFHSDLEAVAVVPEQAPDDWDYDVGHLYRYIVTPRSMVHFLSQTYCFTYLLDLSPSGSTPDVLQDKTLVDFVIPALRTSLTNLVRPFFVPGSQLLLRPDIYVTVIGKYTFYIWGFLLSSDGVGFNRISGFRFWELPKIFFMFSERFRFAVNI